MGRAIGIEHLLEEKQAYRQSGGVSENNRSLGFAPAFLDTNTGIVHHSVNPDGSAAMCHILDGLPEGLVRERDESGRVVAVKEGVVAGFERGGCFYTREQAARFVDGG